MSRVAETGEGAETVGQMMVAAEMNVGSAFVEETPHLEIAVEAPGLAKTVSVDSPARPGSVRTAVEKALRDLGLTRL